MSYNCQAILRDDTSAASVSVQTQVLPAANLVRSGRMTVADTETQLDLSTPIPTAGYVSFINRGSTDTVRIGLATTDYLWELKPGMFALCPLDNSKSPNFFLIGDVNDTENLDFQVRAA